jgi:hypothetical protein
MPEVLACLFGIDLQLTGRPQNCSTNSTVLQVKMLGHVASHTTPKAVPLLKYHTIKMCGEVDVILHIFSTLALDTVER